MRISHETFHRSPAFIPSAADELNENRVAVCCSARVRSWLACRCRTDVVVSTQHWTPANGFEATGRRVRKIMVVALARKLLIALWRFVTDGIVPEGAVLKPAA